MRRSPRTLATTAAVTSLVVLGAAFGFALPALASDEPTEPPVESAVVPPTPELDETAPLDEPSFSLFVADTTAPTVTSFAQVYETQQGGRIAVTLTFDEPVTGLGQGWNGSGTTFTKMYYASKTHTVDFADLAGNPGQYTFTVDKTAPSVVPHPVQVYEEKQGGRMAVTLTFSEPVTGLGQGWYGSGTTWTKVYYRSKTDVIEFTDAVGNPGSYELHVLYATVFDAPTGLAPAGLINHDGDPATWSPVADAVTYQTRIAATEAELAAAALNGPFACAEAAGVCTLAGYPIPDGTWFWQVRGLGSNGVPGPWSAVASVTVDTIAPTAVVTYSTTDATTGNVFAYLAPSEPITITSNNWEARSDGTFRKAYPKNDNSPNWDQTVTFVDAAGNPGTAQVYIDWIDIVAPAVPSTVYPNGWHQDITHFQWTPVTDVNGPVTYEVAIGDHPTNATTVITPAGGVTATSFDYDLPAGPVQWRVRAIDGLGNASEWSDVRGAQEIGTPSIVTPTAGANVTASTLDISWTPVYGVGGVDRYELEFLLDRDLDGVLSSELRSLDDPTWVDASTLAHYTQQFTSGYEGPLSVRVRAVYNIAINGSFSGPWSGSVAYQRDLAKPTITIDAPAASTAVKSDAPLTVTITGRDAGGVSRLVANLYQADGTTLIGPIGSTAPNGYLGASATRSWTIPAGLAEGTYVIRASAADWLGKTTATSLPFVVDRTRPTVTIDVPADGAVLNGDVTVTVTGIDPNGMSSIAANLYNEANTNPLLRSIGQSTAPANATTHSASWTIPGSWFTADGTYTIRAGGVDEAGNNRTVTAQFTIDRVRPTVTIDVPADGASLNTDVTVTVTGVDPNGIRSIAANLYNASNSNPLLKNIGASTAPTGVTSHSATWTIPIAWFTADGTYTIRAGGFDAAGNNRTVTAQFTVDRTGPAAPQPNTPENGRTQANAAPLLDWIAVSDAVSYEVRTSTSPGRTPNVNDGELNGADAETLSATASELQLSGLAQGWLWWQVRGIDALGNVGPWSNIWALGVDTVGPAVSLLTPADGAVLTTGTFTLDWTDGETGATYEVRSSNDPSVDADGALDVSALTAAATTSELALVGVPEATYYWQVRALDTLGNAGPWTTPWMVSVDLPTLSVPGTDGPTGGTGTPGGTGGAGDGDIDLTTFALEEDLPETDEGDEESTDPGDAATPTAVGPASAQTGMDGGMIALLVGLAAALLLLLVVLLAWLRRRRAEA